MMAKTLIGRSFIGFEEEEVMEVWASICMADNVEFERTPAYHE